MAKYINSKVGEQTIEDWDYTNASGSAVTLYHGDVFTLSAATTDKVAALATSSTAFIVGFYTGVEQSVANGATVTIKLDVNPTSEWELETSATGTQGTEYDFTDQNTINVGATTYKAMRCTYKDPGSVTTKGYFVPCKHFYGNANLT